MENKNISPKEEEKNYKEFKEENKEAKNEWEEVIDKVSGVDKELEEKLEEGTATPEDIDELSPGG